MGGRRGIDRLENSRPWMEIPSGGVFVNKGVGSGFAVVGPDFLLAFDVEGAGDFLAVADDDEGVGSGLVVPLEGSEARGADGR